MIVNPEAKPADLRFGLNAPSAVLASSVIRSLARSSAAGPSLSTQDEEAARAQFQGAQGGFMVNWPYVWAAAKEQVPALAKDIGWALYPRVVNGRPSSPPFGGIQLGLGAFSKHPDLALAAARCIASPANQTRYMLSSGNPSAREISYSDPRVRKAFPMADLIRTSLNRAAARPQTPYYNEVSASLQREFHPPRGVNPETTPKRAADFIRAVLLKERLL